MSSVCVHGLGYIGLPTAAMFANYGHDVVGFDVDEELVAELNGGEVRIDEPGLRAFVTQALESGQLLIDDEVPSSKYHIICVPTPLDRETRRVDLSYVRQSAKAIAPELRTGDTVILESTVPPGTTVDTVQPILERDGFDAGEDIALVHCPETVLPGNIITELRENDRIIGGVNGVSTEAAVRLYESFVESEIRTMVDATTAEFVKLIQNTYRDANIALANEIAKLAADYGVDSREAIELANTHPRVELHQPGPGVGGHCLPIDPWFLGHDSDELDLIARARAVNDGMAGYVVDRLEAELGTVSERKIAVLGVAYKGNVGDTRMSPGLTLADELQERALGESPLEARADGDEPIHLSLHDPHVTDQALALDSFDEAVADADALVVTADHTEYESLDPATVERRMAGNVVVDTKTILDETAWSATDIELIRL
ncbi:nucleotide sugar dehydrogenase [Natrinema salifodinae]|uniref:UDP-N-acetyl-D-mannosamine dehydrogenase n=1 Tax=Natrinema salifodinae TaxID=1202768 RepID=A0A1I0M051_9EURY|nr:nucleotide sugar dehydrogenase [Natrinema salifodinae]SEV81129.1 UDP-N-acetyl-D-mannosaminuronic acid dehydrogenase [Natrinema salifodinae]